MIPFPPLAPVPLGLVQAARAVADTIVTLPASPTGLQRWVELLSGIATIVIALALILIALALMIAAWNSRKVVRRINQAVADLNQRTGPIVQHARNVADNVEYVSTAIRGDVERLQSVVADAQTRLVRAADLAEQRINQFNALLEVVQEEAEELFIDTASTIRGVKAGVRVIRDDTPEPSLLEEHIDIDVAGPASRPRRHP